MPLVPEAVFTGASAVDEALAVGWCRGDHVCKFRGLRRRRGVVAVSWLAVARRQGGAVPGGAWADAACCGLGAGPAGYLFRPERTHHGRNPGGAARAACPQR
jgi:hypothetical protein